MNEFEYGRQILAALIPIALTVVVHGLGMDLVRRSFERFGKPLLRKSHNAGARTAFMISVVSIMVLTHFTGIIVWALALLVLEIVPGVEQAVFYSMQYYTTLGANSSQAAGELGGVRWLRSDDRDADVRLVDGHSRARRPEDALDRRIGRGDPDPR